MIRILNTFIFFTLFTFCSYGNSGIVSLFPQNSFYAPLMTTPQVFTSGWEPVSQWQVAKEGTKTRYFYNRIINELSGDVLNKGVVLVFAKGYDFENFQNNDEKPLKLPFYIMPTDETSNGAFAWQYALEDAHVQVTLQMNNEISKVLNDSKTSIQLRYFILSEEFLKQNKLSAPQAKRLNYVDLIQLLNLPF